MAVKTKKMPMKMSDKAQCTVNPMDIDAAMVRHNPLKIIIRLILSSLETRPRYGSW